MRVIGYLNHLFVPLKWKTDNLFNSFLLAPKPSQYHSYSTYHFPGLDSTNIKHSHNTLRFLRKFDRLCDRVTYMVLYENYLEILKNKDFKA